MTAPALGEGGPLENAEGMSADALARLLDARDRLAAAHGRAEPPRVLAPVLRVRIGDALFALPLGEVSAVTPPVRATPLPGAPPALIGLFAHGAALHSLFAVEAALGRPAPASRDRVTAVILRHAGPRVAIAVDEAVSTGQIVSEGGQAGADAAVRFVPLAEGGTIPLIETARLLEALGLGEQEGQQAT